MTLTKQKPKRVPATHQKRHGRHHKHSEHYVKTYWPYLPMIAILVFSFVLNNWITQVHRGVLGYATGISVQGLLNGTNNQRSSNGVGSLALNSQLDQAAQAKANDMAARDYWSHNTPDGATPWSFMTSAGYSYHTAGENLAYGFDTSDGTITGWMNSPEHRANILNTSFVDVGFGIANSSNYQGSGPETIVVAMYASPASAPAPAPAPITPTPKPSASPQPVATSSAEPAPAPASSLDQQSTGGQSAGGSSESKKVPATTTPTSAPTPEPNQERLSRVQLVAGLGAGMAVVITAFLISAFVIFRHSRAWHKKLKRGEKFVIHHPVLDIAAVAAVALLVLISQTSGLIR